MHKRTSRHSKKPEPQVLQANSDEEMDDKILS